MLLVVPVVEGFCEIGEEEFLVLALKKVRLEGCPEGLAVLMGSDGCGEGVNCDERVHVCGFHYGLEEVLDAEILGKLLLGQAGEGVLCWNVGYLGSKRKGFLVLRVGKCLKVGEMVSIV